MGDLKFQLQHYATELWRRKWSILLVSCIIGLLGSFVAATRPDVFTSRAAVEVDDRNGVVVRAGKVEHVANDAIDARAVALNHVQQFVLPGIEPLVFGQQLPGQLRVTVLLQGGQYRVLRVVALDQHLAWLIGTSGAPGDL